jgi:hypothetical protein
MVRRRVSVVSNHEARIVPKGLWMASFLAMTEVVDSPAFPRIPCFCRLIVVLRCYRDSMQAGTRFEAPAQGDVSVVPPAGLVRHGSVMGIC